MVEQISANNVNYWLNDKRIRVDFEKFSEQWTGSVLESFPQSDSGEHQYVLHYRKEKMQAFNATLTLVFLLVSLFLWFYFSTNSYPMEGCGTNGMEYVGCSIIISSFAKRFKGT